MPRGKKFSRSRKEPKIKPKRKEKFNYRTAPYIREREARIEEIENRRKRIEESLKLRQQNYDDDSSEEEEENPVNDLLKTFNHSNNKRKIAVVSESESDEGESIEDRDVEQSEGDIENAEEDSDKSYSESEENEQDNGDELEDDDNLSEESDIENENNTTKIESKEKFSQEDEEIDLDINDYNEEEDSAWENSDYLKDPFTVHLKNDLDSELYQVLTNSPVNVKTEKLNWPTLGNIICQIPQVKTKVNEPLAKKAKVTVLEDACYAEHGKVPELIEKVNLNGLYIKPQIAGNITLANHENIEKDISEANAMTPLQKELFSIINNYQDLFYPERTFDNESQIRFVYCLHALNHLLKTRTKVLHHNAKIQKAKLTDMSQIPDEYRDQGLVRPKVLFIVPFRYSCFKIVELLSLILFGKDKGGCVINKSRFMEDFGGNEIVMPKKNPKPEDYEQTFKGNTDDTFKIGISLTKKTLKLYSDFYSSDIIISSILGLRMLIGAEGEEERDYDFLSSVELLIMDQTEIFFMQNWDHLLHVFDHLHLQPKNSHGTDFGRVRSWSVNGWSKYYKQTLIFSSLQLPEIHAIFNKKCNNYAGKVKIINTISPGSIAQVFVQIPQVFHRFNVNDHSKAIDARFEYFTTKILPQYKDSIMNHTLIYVPSYFDFVKLRNYFRKEDLNFVQICEYSKDAKIARARDMFYHSDAHFLLYTERFHFFRRIKIKGIRHIIFYAPPFPNLYSEMCNLLQEIYQNSKSGSSSNMTITMIYCKYDVIMLSKIVGTERASKMITSEKEIHMMMTGS